MRVSRSDTVPASAIKGSGGNNDFQEYAPVQLWLNDLKLGLVLESGSGAPRSQAFAGMPDVVSIEGVPVGIRVSLNRDYMPMVGRIGHPLVAAVTVFAVAPATLPSLLQAERIAVFCGDEIWAAPLAERMRLEPGSKFRVVARYGRPEQRLDGSAISDDRKPWTVGAVVDVLVQLRDQVGHTHLLRVADQRITSSA
jgi:hypothetical protein